MKKILILCYFFPPNTQIGSWRPYSWAINFHLYGLYPTIITRHWTGDEISRKDLTKEINLPITIENEKNFRLIKLPYKKSLLQKIFNAIGLAALGAEQFIAVTGGRYNRNRPKPGGEIALEFGIK